jgi:hypothetical protein
MRMGGNLHASGRTSFKTRPICLEMSVVIYLAHTKTIGRPDSPFSSPFIENRDMPSVASEEENMYLERE